MKPRPWMRRDWFPDLKVIDVPLVAELRAEHHELVDALERAEGGDGDRGEALVALCDFMRRVHEQVRGEPANGPHWSPVAEAIARWGGSGNPDADREANELRRLRSRASHLKLEIPRVLSAEGLR